MCPLHYRRVKSKGAPGLAFETWDPSNQFLLETLIPRCVIRGEASGSAVRHSCAPLLPAHNLHQASLNPQGNTNLPFVIPGFQEWSAEPQIPRLRSPGFPVELPGVDELHAAFLNESRTRTRRWRPVQEIRVHGPKKMGAALQLFFSRGQDQTIRCLILIAA